MSKAQKPARKSCAGSLIAEIKQNQCLTTKTSSNTGYCQPRHSPVPVPETAIWAFYVTMKPPLLESA